MADDDGPLLPKVEEYLFRKRLPAGSALYYTGSYNDGCDMASEEIGASGARLVEFFLAPGAPVEFHDIEDGWKPLSEWPPTTEPPAPLPPAA